MSSKAIEKLSAIIEEQTEKISELEDKVKHYENCDNWMLHRAIDEEKISKKFKGYDKLPLPRFEMQINPLREDWYEIEWIYGIVYRHFVEDVIFVPMGRTTSNGSGLIKMKDGGELEYPYRDGLHIRTEMNLFNLKGYLLCNGIIEEITDGDYSKETFDNAINKMKRV